MDSQKNSGEPSEANDDNLLAEDLVYDALKYLADHDLMTAEEVEEQYLFWFRTERYHQ